MPDPLGWVLSLAECAAPVAAADDLARAGIDPQPLVDAGLLAEAEPAGAVACDGCGRDHVEPVRWRSDADPPHPYLHCLTAGVVPVDPARLARWWVNPDALAVALSAAVGPSGGVGERLAGRVWHLGPLADGRVGWLVAGWRGETGLADRAPEVLRANAVVFVPSALPPPVVWGRDAPPLVIPVSRVLDRSAAGLAVDLPALARWLTASAAPPPAVADPSQGRLATPPLPADSEADSPTVLTGSPIADGPVASAVSIPPGARWEDLCFHIEADTLRVQADGVDRRLTFAEAGFADRRAGTDDAPRPNNAWHLLTRLARRRGVLGTGDHIDTKPTALRRAMADLGRRLRALTGLTGPPFRSGRGKAYRARFAATATGAVHPPPVGATWDHLTLTELSATQVEVRFEADGVTVLGGEAAVGTAEFSARYEWADLALPPAVETALRALLRGRRLPADSPAVTPLADALRRFLPLAGEPFVLRAGRWVPRFDARSAVRDSGV